MDEPGPLVVIIGPPGAGKSSIGRRIARRMGVGLVDTDKSVAAEHGPIPELFATHGEPHFRALERAAVEQALRTDGVVTLGGGAVLDERTQADLADQRVLLLTVDAAVVAERLAGGGRPLLAGGGTQAWEALVAARRPVYERLADHAIDTSRRPMDAVADDVVTWLREELAR